MSGFRVDPTYHGRLVFSVFNAGPNDIVCRRPAKRTCSLEATGMNVADTVRRLTGIELLWYSKRNLNVPYLCKVGAVFGNAEYRHEERQIESLLDGLPSCFAAHNTARYREAVSSFGIEV